MKNSRLNIGLIFGGKSTEHDISIISALQVYNALNKDKYNVYMLYIDKENNIYMGKELHKLETYKANTYLLHSKQVSLIKNDHEVYVIYKRKKIKIDCFVPVLHGEGVEDGTIAGILEFLGATYVTSDITSSSIAQDKIYTKDILKRYHITTPRYTWVLSNESCDIICESIKSKLRFPVIIKPARLGSSIGIEIANKPEELCDKLKGVFLYSNKLIIEEMVENIKEYNCAAFTFGGKIITSKIEEVTSLNEFLTFEDKYVEKKTKEDLSNKIIPANISEELEEKIIQLTKTIYQILGFKGVIRIDYMYDEKKQRLYFNEVNTIPGSYAYYLFDKCGISFDKMLDMLIKEALIEKMKQTKLVKVFKSNILSGKTLKLNK